MSRLVKGMYGTEFQPVEGRFGLKCGQLKRMGRGEVAHNAGWYNADGQKLGWGDLNAEDFAKIVAGLEPGEVFVVLSEGESFWRFVTEPGLLGSMAVTQPDIEEPGAEYVSEHARYVLTHQVAYMVTRSGKVGGGIEIRGATFQRTSSEKAAEIIRKASIA